MAAASVADNVDYDVLLEFLAELKGELSHTHNGFGVVAVHVEDRSLDSLGDIGGVHHRTELARRSGETNLIVDHYVDGAANFVAAKLRHVENFRHYTLASECGIAVNQNGQERVVVVWGSVDRVDLRAHDSF